MPNEARGATGGGRVQLVSLPAEPRNSSSAIIQPAVAPRQPAMVIVRICLFVCVALGCAAETNPSSAGANKAIIGNFSSYEYYQSSVFAQKLMRESTGAWIAVDDLGAVLRGEYRSQRSKAKKLIQSDRGLCSYVGPASVSSQEAATLSELREHSLCARVAFANQPAPGYCSGFFIYVSTNVALVQTAGHCMKTQYQCDNAAFVASYHHARPTVAQDNTIVPLSPEVRSDRDVYRCKRILAHASARNKPGDAGRDYAIVEVKPPPDATVRRAVALAPLGAQIHQRIAFHGRARLHNVGHPHGVPAKSSVGNDAFHLGDRFNFFRHSVDTSPGQSGSIIAVEGPGGDAVAWGVHSGAPRPFVFAHQVVGVGERTKTVACLDYRKFAEGNEESYGWAQYAYTGAVDMCARGLGPSEFCDPVITDARKRCQEHPELRNRQGCRDLFAAFGDDLSRVEYEEGPSCRRGLNYCQAGKLMDCAGQVDGPGNPVECESVRKRCTFLGPDYGCRDPSVGQCTQFSDQPVTGT